MDSNGRPTKLEDIITAESLIAVMKIPVNRGDIDAEIVEYKSGIYSLEIRMAIKEYIKSRSLNVMLMMMTSSPEMVVSAYMEALVASIDRTIKQRAEMDELREMADK